MPYVEQQALFDQIHPDVQWFDPSQRVAVTTPVSEFKCPTRIPFEYIIATDPGGTSGGFGNHQGSPLRSHYYGVLGANPQVVHPNPPDFCTDRTSPYKMELVRGGASRATPPCFAVANGRVAENGLINRRHIMGSDERLPPVRLAKVTDGTSKTFLVGESAFGTEDDGTRPWIIGVVGEYMYSSKNVAYAINSGGRGPGQANPPRNNMGFGSEHPGGCHFAMGDGSVQFLSENIELVVLFALASRQAGDTVPEECVQLSECRANIAMTSGRRRVGGRRARSGCGKPAYQLETPPVHGKVTLDGQPLPSGYVVVPTARAAWPRVRFSRTAPS